MTYSVNCLVTLPGNYHGMLSCKDCPVTMLGSYPVNLSGSYPVILSGCYPLALSFQEGIL